MKKDRIVRIALAQINPTVGDLEANAEKIIEFISKACALKVDIVAFPELAICGYPPEDLLLKEHFVRDNLKALDLVIKKTAGIIAVVGFVNRDKKGNIYNAAGIIQDRRLKGIYHKIALPNYGVFDEKRYFQSGSRPFIFESGNIRFGVNICEDIWETEGIVGLQAEEGARLIINISASPYYAGKRDLRERLLKKRAGQSGSYICYINLVGGQDELVFDGASMIVSPERKKITSARQFEEELMVADLAIMGPGKKKARSKNLVRLDLLKQTEKSALPEKKDRRLVRLEEVYCALVLGTRDYIRKNGFQKVVLGLSGGIDSALTAVIACDAVGKENVIAVSMPSVYSSSRTQSDAKLLAERLGIKFLIIPINTVFEAYLNVFKKEFAGLKPDITEENLQARIRGNILMALSNKFGWLVLTTGNKSETSCGYCTLYGDMAGGFAVIKDVPKTLVYKLAEFRNRKTPGGIIPHSIFTRTPSAELKENQKDQDSLPPYPVLDAILKKYVEEDRSYEEIVSSTEIKPGIIKEVVRMVDRNEYKRRQAPPGVKITPRAFGKDRRLPITNRYEES